MSLNKIESIKKLKKKGMYEITINGCDYIVTEDLIVKYTLIKGRELTTEELSKIESEIINENLLLKVYNYISYQFRSEYEIKKYLYGLSANENQVNDIIIKLKSLNMIDDNYLSVSILNYCIAQLKGPKIYKNKLYERRIEIIHNYNDNDQIEAINKSIEKNKDKNKKLPALKQKLLLTQKLLRDGFEEKYVYKLIDEVSFDDDTDEQLERLIKEYEKLQIKYSKYTDYEKRNRIINNLMSKGYTYKQISKLINN